MKCPYPQSPRWVKELRLTYAREAGQNLANAILYLSNLVNVDSRAEPILDELRLLERRFRDLYDEIICEYMKED